MARKKEDFIDHRLDSTKKVGKGDRDLMMGFSFNEKDSNSILGGKGKGKKNINIYDTDLL